MVFSLIYKTVTNAFKIPPPLAGIGANLSKNALDFLPPFQGESRGGDGINFVISISYKKLPHPHPSLPLEREGTKNLKLALMPLAGGDAFYSGNIIRRKPNKMIACASTGC